MFVPKLHKCSRNGAHTSADCEGSNWQANDNAEAPMYKIELQLWIKGGNGYHTTTSYSQL